MKSLKNRECKTSRYALLLSLILISFVHPAQITDSIKDIFYHSVGPKARLYASYQVISRFIDLNKCDSTAAWLHVVKGIKTTNSGEDEQKKIILKCILSRIALKCETDYELAEQYAKEATLYKGDDKQLKIIIGFASFSIYELKEQYELASGQLQNVYKWSTEIRDTSQMITALFYMAKMSDLLNMYGNNKKYVVMSMDLAGSTHKRNDLARATKGMGLYYSEGYANGVFNTDSALKYLKLSLSYTDPEDVSNLLEANILISSTFTNRHNLKDAAAYLDKASVYLPYVDDKAKAKYYLFYGYFSFHSGKYERSIDALKKSVELNNRVKGSLFMDAENYLFISTAYERLGDYRRAYECQCYREQVKDTLNKIQLKKKTESLDKGFQAMLNEKENRLLKAENSLKETELRRKDTILVFLLLISVLGIGLVFYVFRNYGREKKHVIVLDSLNKKLSAQHEEIVKINGLLRLKVLRTQMNPHFIYNCLNAINHLVLKDEVDKASGYLLSFAKLLRQVLDFSDKDFVDLEEEIAFINLYLSLEAMRFGSDFTYEIHTEQGMLEDDISIPSLLIQPFIENAIWHAFPNKEGNKRISVDFKYTQSENKILCGVEDNGVGRKENNGSAYSIFKPEHESKGIRITQERIEMLQFQIDKDISIKFSDRRDTKNSIMGTRVELILPTHYKI